MTRLTGRDGTVILAAVVVHAPMHAKAATACGLTFAELAAANHLRNQTSACSEYSDVTCPVCRTR